MSSCKCKRNKTNCGSRRGRRELEEINLREARKSRKHSREHIQRDGSTVEWQHQAALLVGEQLQYGNELIELFAVL